MNDSCAIGLPGHRTMGTRVRFVISRVSVPWNPGSTNPAVAWTISPSRPSELLPSMRGTEDELAGVEDERLGVGGPHHLGEVGEVLLHVDHGPGVAAEHEEAVIEAHVDRAGLDHLGVERLDDDAAGLDLGAGVAQGRRTAGARVADMAGRGATVCSAFTHGPSRRANHAGVVQW